MNIKGIIFDFNGTLFFDTYLHNQAWDIFLNRYNLCLSDDEKSYKIHGKNNAEILTNIFSKKLSAKDITNLSIEKEDIYQSLCLQQKMELAPGATDFLEFLHSKNIPFTIATASDLYNVRFYFKQLDLGRYFDLSKVIYNNGTIKSKPDPEIFIKAMAALKIKANQTLIFEDSASGIKAAENSNAAKVIIVNSTNANYSQFNHEVISTFSKIDGSIF